MTTSRGQLSRDEKIGIKSAAVVIVKDEERFILEWLAYNVAIGFDSIVVYDNNSTDRTNELVKLARRFIDVRLICWPDKSPLWQVKAYGDAIDRFGEEFDWMGFFDVDEFLAFEVGCDLHAMLQDRASDQAIALRWRIFGSAQHISPPADLVIGAYQTRADESFTANAHVKSLVRPGAVDGFLNPHAVRLRGIEAADTGYVWPNGDPVHWIREAAGLTERPPHHASAWLNHYFVKSGQDWASKVSKGYNGEVRSAQLFELYDRNEVLDPIDPNLVARTRELVEMITQAHHSSSALGN